MAGSRTLPNASKGKRSRSGTPKQHQFAVRIWSAIFLGSALLALGIAFLLWMKSEKRAGQSTASADARSHVVRIESKFPAPSDTDAIHLCKQAVETREEKEIGRIFKLDGTPAKEVVDFLSKLPETDGTIVDFTWWGSINTNGLPVEGVIMSSRKNDQIHYRLIHLTPDAQGHWQVDFHSMARTCTPAWDQLLQPETRGGQARVLLFKDNYYNGLYGDESEWACYRITDESGKKFLLGYCKRNTPQDRAITRIFNHSAANDLSTPPMAFLEIQRRDGGDGRQLEITRVLAEGWVSGSVPFDGSQP